MGLYVSIAVRGIEDGSSVSDSLVSSSKMASSSGVRVIFFSLDFKIVSSSSVRSIIGSTEALEGTYI